VRRKRHQSPRPRWRRRCTPTRARNTWRELLPTWPAEKTGPAFWPQIQLLHGYVGIPGPRPFSSPSTPRGRMSVALQPLPSLARLVERPNHFARVIWKSRYKFLQHDVGGSLTAVVLKNRQCELCLRIAAGLDRDPEEARKILDPVVELMMDAVTSPENSARREKVQCSCRCKSGLGELSVRPNLAASIPHRPN
jgi:hypothetical protein